MDFLDPKKQRRHKLLLICGYILIGLAIAGATTVLLYEAYGFGLGKGGNIIQKGLVYLSSQPHPAAITLNGKLQSTSTNTALTLPEGIYSFSLNRSGYQPWSRQIEVDGGMIESYTYPLLIPNKLVTTNVKAYSSIPEIASQSPNRQWLVIQTPADNKTFDVYDLTNPALAPTQINLPSSIVTQVPAGTSESWQAVVWSTDNQHLLLNHVFGTKNEYLMVNIANPSQSINLSQTLNGVSFSQISLLNNHFDQYYLYNAASQTLMTDNLNTPTTPTTVLTNVLAFDSYGGNTILYATTSGAPAGKVNVDELIGGPGGTNYHIKTLAGGTTYLLNEAGYSGSPYVVAGAASENKVYIYNNPIGQLQANPKQAPVPVQVMLINNPSSVSFSTSAQFVEAESSQQFAVYNIENAAGYTYQTTQPLDAPQTKATWMDGDRLTYVSGGKLIMFEYDHNYSQSLMTASPNFTAFFTPSYNYAYALTPAANSTYQLTRTSLYTPADQPQKL